MAAPLVVSTASGRTTGTDTTHSAAATGGGIGDYIILLTATVGNFGGESATGFTLLETTGQPSSTGLIMRAYWKVAASGASEGISVSTDDPCYFAYITYRVSGVSAIQTDSAVDTGGDQQPPPLTISDLSVDHRVIAAASWDGSDGVVGYPYTDYQVYDAAGSSLGLASCSDVVGGSPVTPGPFPETFSNPPWVAITIALAGSAPGGDGEITNDGDDCVGYGYVTPVTITTELPDTMAAVGIPLPPGGTERPDEMTAEGFYADAIVSTGSVTEQADTMAGVGFTSGAAIIERADTMAASGTITGTCYIAKVWNGSAWVNAPMRYFDGSVWQLATAAKICRGGTWIGCS